jgi:hypothetical protein
LAGSSSDLIECNKEFVRNALAVRASTKQLIQEFAQLTIPKSGKSAAAAWIFERGNAVGAELVKQRVECDLWCRASAGVIEFAPSTIEQARK